MNFKLQIIATLVATLLMSSKLVIAADSVILQEKTPEQQKVYGKQLMTEQERSEQRSKMRAATTDVERDKIRKDNQLRMKQRAKEQGVTLINKKQNKEVSKRLASTPNINKLDKRLALTLNLAQQTHVLSEMRSLLAGTQAIVAALATDDMKTVVNQARLLGMDMKKKPENKLSSILPKAFMMQGKAVHRAFDSIADDAESIKNSKHTLKQLGEALSICQGCHEMYRIEVNNTTPGMSKQSMRLLHTKELVK